MNIRFLNCITGFQKGFKKFHKHIGIAIIFAALIFVIIRLGSLKPEDHTKLLNGITNINSNIEMIGSNMEEMHKNLLQMNKSIKLLAVNDSIQSDQLQKYPSSQPIPMDKITKLSSIYSLRIDPITGHIQQHTGIDYIAAEGTPVISTANGIVKEAGINDGYGLIVKIDHLNGYESDYAHLSKVLVHKDQKIKRGDLIGYSGNTGNSTGPHLHYQILFDAKYVNPRIFYRN
jgi:murein DD-endopeptidase MepM/ murein hydrolase activator NlpD